MSLITIKRSSTPTNIANDLPRADFDEDKSQSEDFFASSSIAVLQNQIGRRRVSIIKAGDNIQWSLTQSLKLLRDGDSVKVIANLEKANAKLDGYRCFCVINSCKPNIDEFAILGIDIISNEATIGLVLPIYQDMSVILDGDGAFRIKNMVGEKLFKPTAVKALWSIVQLLNRACCSARKHNYYAGGLSHMWINFYTTKITSNRAQIAEWNKMIDADAKTNSSLAPNSAIGEYVFGTLVDATVREKAEIRKHLKNIMFKEDMDNVTVTYIREKLEQNVTFCLKEYRSFIAEEILIICGQMDSASQILPYLYLGSTYNACNHEELKRNKISHILNVTRESENFYLDEFIYENIEVFDVEHTNMLKVFKKSYQFISKAKNLNSACLVHCQQGISRSATVVIAYMMKEFNWTRDKALEDVRQKRDCVNPNDGFMLQLKTYEGMLNARRNANETFISRNKRDSLPNEFCVSDDRNVEYSSSSAPRIKSQPIYNQYNCMTKSVSDDNCSSVSAKISNQSSRNVDAEDFSKICLSDNADINQNDSVFDDNDISNKSDQNSSIRRSGIKDDDSWIKPGTSLSPVSEDQRKVANNSTNLIGNEGVSSSGDNDIDQQSLRPVKELMTKYGHSDK